jgi:hypothetical protein
LVAPPAQSNLRGGAARKDGVTAMSFLYGFAFTMLAMSFLSLIPLSALTQSGATANQIITWNGTSWVAQ